MVATVAVVLVFQEFLAFQACLDRKVRMTNKYIPTFH
jgi:hypothetical protein